ncbi:MAG: glycosyltransferase family 2 protein, partial [Anaerolineales bacterium]|nr:glycosyltransferase family 2 protein [Anaerolineales bacterium]
MTELDLSIVVPVYNEEENLRPLLAEITAALKEEPIRYEVVFVDDGSSDTSFAVLEQLHKEDDRVVAIQFRRNHGQTAAFAAGFEQARGRYILTIDADRQNDPADIPAMIKKLEEGYD